MDAFPISSELLGKSASAYEHLRRAVSRGQLRPGRRLSATGLAAHFKISETPVREALVRLAAEGFLAWEASKGHFTKPVTLEEQADLHDVLAINLNACLHQGEASAPNLPDVLQAADGDNLDGRQSDEQVSDLMARLGGALAARKGNAVLRALMSNLFDRTLLIRQLDLDTPERVALVRLRIAGLAAAVRASDAATAMAIVAEHLAERRQRLPLLVEAANRVAATATYP